MNNLKYVSMNHQNYKTNMMNKIIKKNKYIENRKATPKEILYIFEKLLENN